MDSALPPFMHLSTAEKLGGVHGDLRVAVPAVRSVEVLPDAHGPADGGLKAGTRIPGTIEYGTIWQAGRKIFAAVHPHTPRGVRVVLEGSGYAEWIVGCADPETVARTLAATVTGGTPAA